MSKASFFDRLRYRFDDFMSKGTIALIGGLAVLSAIVVLIAAAVVILVDIRPEGTETPLRLSEAIWLSMMRTLDAGTMGGDTGWGFRLVMFMVTLGGIFIISALIGVLTSGLESRMAELRKGRSRVIEKDHTVILGWSAQVFSIISELVIANENQVNPCIVVMGSKDKVEMEDEIKAKVGDTGHTRIVCRNGNPIDLDDLVIPSLPTARSIIILASENEHPDADVIKTMLAVLNRPASRQTPYHIVAEIHNPQNLEVARLVARDQAELVLVGDLIARIIAQTSRQSGLSVVYTELLNFSGDEIYFKTEPGLVGKSFGESLFVYEDSAVIGLKKGEAVLLNPPMQTSIEPGDQIIAISPDDDAIYLSGLVDLNIQEGAIQTQSAAVPDPERILVLGWNDHAASIVKELDHYIAPGSLVTVAARDVDIEAEIARCCPQFAHMQVDTRFGDTSDRAFLEQIEVGSYENVIVLSYSDLYPQQVADAITLVTLLHLRDLADRHAYRYSIVSEMLDIRDRALAEVTRADDFIVSDQLVSLMLSQISENKHLGAVFADIFDPEGSEIYLKPHSDYILPGAEVNFYTVVAAAQRRDQVAIGYRRKSQATDASKSYGVVINPPKSQPVTFSDGDCVIVIAQE